MGKPGAYGHGVMALGRMWRIEGHSSTAGEGRQRGVLLPVSPCWVGWWIMQLGLWGPEVVTTVERSVLSAGECWWMQSEP